MSSDGERLHAALSVAWERLCGVLEGARFEHRDGYLWTVCPSVPVPQFNGVWPTDDSGAPALESALAEVSDLGLPYSLQVRAGRTPAFEQEAERLGLVVQTEMPGMLVESDELQNVEVDGLQLIRVRTGDGLAQALAIAAEGFGAPPEIFTPLYTPEVVEVGGLEIYVGRAGEIDVTTGVGFTTGDAVGIFTIATPPAHRGRGYGAAVTACAAREGFAAGAKFAYLQSSTHGYGVYKRLGFYEVERYLLYTAPEAPATDVSG
jgi:ribosomal protein S18 acetylase RimI-like enzyme